MGGFFDALRKLLGWWSAPPQVIKPRILTATGSPGNAFACAGSPANHPAAFGSPGNTFPASGSF